MKLISRKKLQYPVSDGFAAYLERYGRRVALPLAYEDLLRNVDSYPLIDRNGKDTLWQVMIYEAHYLQELNQGLVRIYALLKLAGEMSSAEHLFVDRVDYCAFGNSLPFRIRIVNQYNDNHDYFYIKRADASRIYGLELEELFSPNSIHYLYDGNTLIEQHIIGVPGDDFIHRYFKLRDLNKIRVAKEFIKFNERCFVRLLGDMRSYNYVVRVIPDFEDSQFRVRAIDFDQQSYEGKRTLYQPQFYKENLPVVQFCTGLLNYETMFQYQREERALMSRRANTAPLRVLRLKNAMIRDELSRPEKIEQLREELADYHEADHFRQCQTIGEIVFAHVEHVLPGHLKYLDRHDRPPDE